MQIRSLLFLCGLCLCMYSVYGQKLQIRDATTGNPLEAVTVNSPDAKKLWVTDKYGKVDISALKGVDEIIIRSIGYQTYYTTYLSLKKNNFLVFLQPNLISLEQIVVSATKWSQNASGVPSKVSSISPYKATLLQPQTTADLLGMSGEVFIQKSQQGGGSPMIRGFATNRLLYTVDGVRMNTAIFRSGNIQNVISLDPFSMRSTEVLFGPGSTIYGSDAIGGVMSFRTKKAKLKKADEGNKVLIEGNVTGRYASANNENTVHADVNIGLEKIAFLSSISYQSYDHLKMGSNGPQDYLKPYKVIRENNTDVVLPNPNPEVQVPSAFDQLNFMQKVSYSVNENMQLNYGFHFSETSAYGRYDRHNRIRNGLPRYAEWKYGPQKWLMNHIELKHTSSSFYDEMKINLAVQRFEESRINRDLNDDFRNNQVEKVDAYSFNADFITELDKKSSLYYGTEYVLNNVNSNGFRTNIVNSTTVEAAPRYPDATWQSAAIYLNYKRQLATDFTFQGGLRYNILTTKARFNLQYYQLPFEDTSIQHDALTASAGITYQTNNDWLWSANLATAFRAPNVDDIGKVFDSEPSSVVVPNPDLESEYAYNADISLSKIVGSFLKVDITTFYTLLNNAMVRRDYRLGDRDSIVYLGELSKVQAIQNAAVANVYGIQFASEWKFFRGFSASSTVNFQRGLEETDDGNISRSRHAAPLFGVVRLNYRYKKLRAELNTQFQAKVEADDLPVSEQSKTEIYALNNNGEAFAPAWYTLNLKVNYRFSALFNLSLGVENITDQRYRPYSSGISGAGRNITMSMNVNF